MNKYLKQAILWAFILMPYIYLASIWNQLPEQVPTHFGLDGEADDWSSKFLLILVPAGLGIGIYLFMYIIPALDPKKKIEQMGDKYDSFRFALTLFFSVLGTYLIYITDAGSIKNPNVLFAMIGVILAVLANYFQTVRPNYFIGFRTPWTLESENVWKKTHRLGGKLWISGGLLISILAFLIKSTHTFFIIFGVIVFLMAAIPVVYSYIEFQKEKNALDK